MQVFGVPETKAGFFGAPETLQNLQMQVFKKPEILCQVTKIQVFACFAGFPKNLQQNLQNLHRVQKATYTPLMRYGPP